MGHRLKGTVVYLGAQPAVDAARAVELFERSGGERKADAEHAIAVLEQQIEALKAAAARYRPATE